MKLRRLKIKDAIAMCEWMHDDSVTRYLQKDFSHKNIFDCISFILKSFDKKTINYAIVNDDDKYMGTVSLKNINNSTAEFAIVVRKIAMGKGYAAFAIKEIIDIALIKYNIRCIYWYVNRINQRAIKFYDKLKYKRIDKNVLLKRDIDIDIYERDVLWYAVFNN